MYSLTVENEAGQAKIEILADENQKKFYQMPESTEKSNSLNLQNRKTLCWRMERLGGIPLVANTICSMCRLQGNLLVYTINSKFA